MTRNVVPADQKAYFSSTFYPVDSSITLSDSLGEKSLTVWNDRPQAGAVHYDGSLKLLIDRAPKTKDYGGIPQSLFPFQHNALHLNFALAVYETQERSQRWLAQRNRGLQAFSFPNFSYLVIFKDLKVQKSIKESLVNLLSELSVT